MNSETRRERILAHLDPDSPLRLPLPLGPRPALHAEAGEQFEQQATQLESEVVHIQGLKAVPAWIQERFPNGDLSIAPALQELDWSGFEQRIAFGASNGKQTCTVSRARCGIAETGTLVLTSSADTPTSLNFLPDLHIVVLNTDQIVPHMEDAWALLRESGEFPPRALNLITGPSRTADIEQTIQLGAHGPRALTILIIG